MGGGIEIALQNKLEQRAAAREAQAKAAQKEIAEFTGEFLSAARQCFQLIDKDCGGSRSPSGDRRGRAWSAFAVKVPS